MEIEEIARRLAFHGYVNENYDSYGEAEADGASADSDYETGWGWWQDVKADRTYGVPGLGEVLFVGHEELVGNKHLLVFNYQGKHYTMDGEWVSHDGMYWEGDLTEVRPREVTKIEWETVK